MTRYAEPEGCHLEEGAAARLAAPLAGLWRSVTSLRNAWWDRVGGTVVDGITVISIGNLVAGGTGKTPMSARIASVVSGWGMRTAVVTNGHAPDEVLLHRRWNPDIPVLADRNRVSAVRRAREHGISVAVLDDGFQHRKLARDLDLVLVAVEDPLQGHALPRGRHREPFESLDRAHAVVLTRRTASLEAARERAASLARWAPGRVLGCARFTPTRWLDVRGATRSPPTGPIFVLAAIARPEAFVTNVRDTLAPGTDVRWRGFPDHHPYSRSEIRSLLDEAEGRTLVVTEKDAVKLAALDAVPPSTRVLTARFAWDWGEAAVWARVGRAVDLGGSMES